MSEPAAEGTARPRPIWPWILGVAAVTLIATAVTLGTKVAHFRAVRAKLAAHHGQLRIEGSPEWLARIAGEDVAVAFGRVRGVTFRAANSGFPVPMTDDELVASVDLLAEFADLESVVVRSWTPLGDQSLIALRRLHGLRELSVSSSSFSDDSVRGIADDLPELASLSLPGSRIGDEGAIEIARLRALERLVLDGTNIGDEGARRLATLLNLRELSLSQTYVTDEGVRFLSSRIPELTVSDD